MKTFDDGLSFSPVFKPQKAGSVVNMGNINANDVLLIGHKVSIDGGNIHGMHNANTSGDALKTPSGKTANKIHLVGNEVNIQVDGIKSNSIIASAYSKGALQQSTTSYVKESDKINGFKFDTQEYDNIENKANKELVTKDKFEKHATIGSDLDWWHFAYGWNYDRNNMRNFFNTYKLTSDIDFGGNQGKNYASYCTGGYCTNMIVGGTYSGFSKIFDGQGFTLKNINIDARDTNIGIFGFAKGAIFKNINVDYMGGNIKTWGYHVGGFIGGSNSSNFDNILVKNIGTITNSNYGSAVTGVGSFIGRSDGGNSFNNIIINNIGTIYNYGRSAGGFAGMIDDRFDHGQSKFTNIKVSNIKNIITNDTWGYVYAGGFGGEIVDGYFSNITIQGIDKIDSNSKSFHVYAGGFGGKARGIFNNIVLSSINDIMVSNVHEYAYAGGFGGNVAGTFSNIYLKDINNIYVRASIYDNGAGGFAGNGYGKFNNIVIDNIKNINVELERFENAINVTADVGGFIGLMEYGSDNVFKNISIKNIGKLNIIGDHEGENQGDFWRSNIGGFIGYSKNSNVAFDNIYIFFNNNSKFYAEASGNQISVGKFLGKVDKKIDKFNNIHIYHHKNDLINANYDSNLWNDFYQNGYVNNKLNIHFYDDTSKNKVYQDFKVQDNSILRPIISKPIPPTTPD
ncbi:hypothetical protein I9T54_00930, partial [Campylobacter peloridis]|nr:hypothetical protein [Campylobacter peloridis]